MTMTRIMVILTFFHHMALARPLLDFLNVRDWKRRRKNLKSLS